MVEEISDTIRDKIKEITKDENYQKILVELLQKTSAYNKQTKPAYIKKEFQLLVDQYFPFPKEVKGSNDDG